MFSLYRGSGILDLTERHAKRCYTVMERNRSMCGISRDRHLKTEARRLRNKEDRKFKQEARARKVTDKPSSETPKDRDRELVNG